MPSAQSSQDDDALNQCLERPPTRQRETAKRFSDQFSSGDKRTILASIWTSARVVAGASSPISSEATVVARLVRRRHVLTDEQGGD
jgi:hypothetical protein